MLGLHCVQPTLTVGLPEIRPYQKPTESQNFVFPLLTRCNYISPFSSTSLLPAGCADSTPLRKLPKTDPLQTRPRWYDSQLLLNCDLLTIGIHTGRLATGIRTSPSQRCNQRRKPLSQPPHHWPHDKYRDTPRWNHHARDCMGE